MFCPPESQKKLWLQKKYYYYYYYDYDYDDDDYTTITTSTTTTKGCLSLMHKSTDCGARAG